MDAVYWKCWLARSLTVTSSICLLFASACRTPNSNSLVKETSQASELNIPNDPMTPITCPSDNEPGTFTLKALDATPTNLDFGLPDDVQTHPRAPSPDNNIRLDGCIASDDTFALHRIFWRTDYNASAYKVVIKDPAAVETSIVNYQVGDLNFQIYRLPPAAFVIEHLQEAIFGEQQLLKIDVLFQDHTISNELHLKGATSNGAKVVAFWQFWSYPGFEGSHNGFAIGDFQFGNDFFDPATGCLANWKRTTHKWEAGTAKIVASACSRSTGTVFAGWTINYVFDKFVIDDTNAALPVASQQVELTLATGLKDALKVESSHHNFNDCAVVTLPNAIYMLNLSRGWSSCSIAGVPEPVQTETLPPLFYNIRYGQGAWNQGNVNVTVGNGFDEWIVGLIF